MSPVTRSGKHYRSVSPPLNLGIPTTPISNPETTIGSPDSRIELESPQNLREIEEPSRRSPSSSYSSYSSPPSSPETMDNPPLNPLVQPRGLPIVVPEGLQAAPMPPNLPRFKGTRDEDPSMHVERFIELLTTCLITDHRYYLVWFPTTLKESTYEWYRNHAVATFHD